MRWDQSGFTGILACTSAAARPPGSIGVVSGFRWRACRVRRDVSREIGVAGGFIWRVSREIGVVRGFIWPVRRSPGRVSRSEEPASVVKKAASHKNRDVRHPRALDPSKLVDVSPLRAPVSSESVDVRSPRQGVSALREVVNTLQEVVSALREAGSRALHATRRLGLSYRDLVSGFWNGGASRRLTLAWAPGCATAPDRLARRRPAERAPRID